MRTRVFSWALAIGMAALFALPAAAITPEVTMVAVKKKKLKKLKHPVAQKLEGMFQMCIKYNGELRPMPVLKHYDLFGRYTTYTSINGRMGISGKGTYSLADLSMPKHNKYTETLAYLSSAKELADQDNTMEMAWVNDDIFVITYQLPNMSEPSSEIWVRVVEYDQKVKGEY
ncbi:MAG: DUF4488 domain-containing protein [Bacteroidales bacterium]|nr:DUF4488 domain-containing protein [Bacteroidales bacterium]